MSIDLSNLSIAELEVLAKDVQAEIGRKQKLARNSLINDMEKLARAAGVSLSDLFGEDAAKKTKAKAKGSVAPKYRNPNDAGQTWTGRGRQPTWLVALLAEGKALADLAI